MWKMEAEEQLRVKWHGKDLAQQWSWRRKWQSTPVILPAKSHGQRSLAGHKRLRHDLATKQWQPCRRRGGLCKTTAVPCPMCPHPLPVRPGHFASRGLYPCLLDLGSLPYGPLVSHATWKLGGLRWPWLGWFLASMGSLSLRWLAWIIYMAEQHLR